MRRLTVTALVVALGLPGTAAASYSAACEITGTIVSGPERASVPARGGATATMTSFSMSVQRAEDSANHRNDGSCASAFKAGRLVTVTLRDSVTPKRKGETVGVLYRNVTSRGGLDRTWYELLPVIQ